MLASILRILLGLAIAYVVLVALAWRFQERIAVPGSPGRLLAPGAAGMPDGQIVELTTADGVRLRGWYLPPAPRPQGRSPAVLWFYGNLETVSGLAPIIRWLRPPQTAVLALDYRGHGESGGKPTEANLYADAEAAWGWLAQRPDVDSERIAVYGRSVGAAPALYVATTRPVRALVLDSPFTSAAAMARRHYPFLPRFILRVSMDNLTRAARLTAPLLVFHGSEDDIAPVTMGRAVAETGHAREFVVINGAGHNETYDVGGEEYRTKMQAFLRANLASGPHARAP